MIGKVDSETGYNRIEYTVSKRYRKSADRGTSSNPGVLEAWEYYKSPPPKALQWFYKTILRMSISPSGPNPNDPLHTITQATFRGVAPFGGEATVDKVGSIHVDVKPFGSIVSEQHLPIAGCPAIWCTINISDPLRGGNQKVRYYLLFVKPRDKPIMYAFAGLDDKENPTGILEEMVSIRDSIKITNTGK